MKKEKDQAKKKFSLDKFEVLQLKTMTKIVGGQQEKDKDTITPPTARI